MYINDTKVKERDKIGKNIPNNENNSHVKRNVRQDNGIRGIKSESVS